MPGKVSKPDAEYGPGSLNEHCGNCVMLRESKNSETGYICTKVEGPVQRSKWCKFWYGKGNKRGRKS